MRDISLNEVQAAAARIQSMVRRTPLLDGGELSREAGVTMQLVCERLGIADFFAAFAL